MLDKESLIERCPRVAELDESSLERPSLTCGQSAQSRSIGILEVMEVYKVEALALRTSERLEEASHRRALARSGGTAHVDVIAGRVEADAESQ